MYFSNAFTLSEKVQIFFYDMKKNSKRIRCAASEEILKDLNGKDREYIESTLEKIKNGKFKDDKLTEKNRKKLIELIESKLAEMETPAEEANEEAPVEEVKEESKKAKKEKKEKKEENKNDDSVEVSENTSAASNCGPRVEDAPIGVDFSALGGFPVNNGYYDEKSDAIMPEAVKHDPAPAILLPPLAQIQNPEQQMTQEQIVQHYQQNVANHSNIPNFGMHKVDNPPKQKPPVQNKAHEDTDVNTEGLEKIEVETDGSEQPNMNQNEAIQNPIPSVDPEDVYVPLNPVFDNSKLTNMPNRQYLAKIEEVALACGYQIQMVERQDTKLILCYVYADGSNTPSINKNFTIDPGMIYDARAKMYPFIVMNGYEEFNPYPVLVPNGAKNVKTKSKNEFNKRLFEDMIVGGADNITDQRHMIRNDLFELNKFMAVITIPRKNMDAETRKKVEDRLIAAMKAGVFNAAKQYDQKARFRVKDNTYNKKNNSFVLTTKGMRPAFGSNELCTVPIEISFGSNGETKVTKMA